MLKKGCPDKIELTPLLLFELYTYNYQRTLFEKILNDKIDDAMRAVEEKNSSGCFGKKNQVDSENQGVEEFSLNIFIELLNILDIMVFLKLEKF